MILLDQIHILCDIECKEAIQRHLGVIIFKNIVLYYNVHKLYFV